jgi:hypothetical protein
MVRKFCRRNASLLTAAGLAIVAIGGLLFLVLPVAGSGVAVVGVVVAFAPRLADAKTHDEVVDPPGTYGDGGLGNSD